VRFAIFNLRLVGAVRAQQRDGLGREFDRPRRLVLDQPNTGSGPGLHQLPLD